MLWLIVALAAVGWCLAPPARAADPENCLGCHRYRGLARPDDGGRIHLFYVDPDYYDHTLGPHARIACTGCHPRSEVEAIPHKPVTPVDCTRTCHLAQPGHVAVDFAHDRIGEMLDSSVHKHDILDRANELLGKPLADGQARCLLCHDEPMFRRPNESLAAMQAPVQRCSVCHTEELPVNTVLAFWHVYSRSRPARSHEDQVRVCGMCHSNPAIRGAFGLPHSTASYLASFHGKAMLLGSEETASCLNCHVGEMQNVHLMLAQDDPESSISKGKLPDTCRNIACHPTAGAPISSAAVHFDIATTRGIEYFIGAVFVLLVLSTFGPSLVLQMLELVQMVIGRYDSRMYEHEHLAERLMRTHEGRTKLKRFSPHQRVQHWILFATFTTLVLTGFPIKFADRAWARWVIDLFGGLNNARRAHHYAGALLMIGFAYHIGYVIATAIQDKRRSKQGWLTVIFNMPMMATPKDLRQFFHTLGFLLFIKKTRPQGDRFTLKEKFEYFGVFWGTLLLGFTGIFMWFNAWTTEHLPGRVLTIALLLHTFEAFLALLHVGVIHMIGVIFSPVVFPLSPAMFSGDTPAEEMAEVHSGMLHRVAGELGIRPEEGGHHA